MIVNIRGTSGSGKTTLVRALMAAHQGTNTIMGVDPTRKSDKPVVVGYGTNDGKVALIGKYETACGGCDTIKTQDEVQRRIRNAATVYPHVVFEGLLISHIYGRWAQMARDEYPGQWAFAFLDTPLEVCLDRVRARRAAKGNTSPLDITNTQQKWYDSQRVAEKARVDGFRVVTLPWQDPLPVLEALLK